jgi:hypothetical protein
VNIRSTDRFIGTVCTDGISHHPVTVNHVSFCRCGYVNSSLMVDIEHRDGINATPDQIGHKQKIGVIKAGSISAQKNAPSTSIDL